MKLIIIRGPSGSGKSTIAQKLGGVAQKTWFEADMYMIDSEGQYDFHPARLDEVHNRCLLHTEFALKTHEPLVIVSNTFCSLREIQRYIELAIEYDYEYMIYRTQQPWNIEDLYARNTHNVPRETIERQIHKYVPIEGEIEWHNTTCH